MSDCAYPATRGQNPVGFKPQDVFCVSNESVRGQKVMEEEVVPVHGMEVDAGMVV